MTALLAVAAGGALGALGRYVVIGRVGAWLGTDFPYGTLVVNIVGSFLLGLIVAVVANQAVDDRLLLFLGVGVMGGFTTFSTFALDVAYLAGRHARPMAAVYVVVSVVLSIGAFAVGFAL
jgi:CrcB protein